MSATTITISLDAATETVQTHIQAAPGADPWRVLETAIAALRAEQNTLAGCPAHRGERAPDDPIGRARDRISAIISEYGRHATVPAGLAHDVLGTVDWLAEALSAERRTGR